MKFCGNCGRPRDAGWYCLGCGMPYPTPRGPAEIPAVPPALLAAAPGPSGAALQRRRRWPSITGAAVVVAVLGAGGVVALTSGTDDATSTESGSGPRDIGEPSSGNEAASPIPDARDWRSYLITPTGVGPWS